VKLRVGKQDVDAVLVDVVDCEIVDVVVVLVLLVVVVFVELVVVLVVLVLVVGGVELVVVTGVELVADVELVVGVPVTEEDDSEVVVEDEDGAVDDVVEVRIFDELASLVDTLDVVLEADGLLVA